MSLRRNQLKKMTLDQIMERLGEETDSDNIKLITSFLADKNQVLLEKRTELTDRLLTIRNKIQKNVHGMNVHPLLIREGSRTGLRRRKLCF